MKELRQREWYKDPKFLIPSAVAILVLVLKLLR
jgi:hypothetical protein